MPLAERPADAAHLEHLADAIGTAAKDFAEGRITRDRVGGLALRASKAPRPERVELALVDRLLRSRARNDPSNSRRSAASPVARSARRRGWGGEDRLQGL